MDGHETHRLEPIDHRDVVDATGGRWRITESRVVDVPGALAARCLIFDSPAVCRRLWIYPRDWMSWSDAALVALMDRLARSDQARFATPGDSMRADRRADG